MLRPTSICRPKSLDYVAANEAFLAAERRRIREQAIAEGYLKPDSD